MIVKPSPTCLVTYMIHIVNRYRKVSFYLDSNSHFFTPNKSHYHSMLSSRNVDLICCILYLVDKLGKRDLPIMALNMDIINIFLSMDWNTDYLGNTCMLFKYCSNTSEDNTIDITYRCWKVYLWDRYSFGLKNQR